MSISDIPLPSVETRSGKFGLWIH